jgi:RNase P subunit RPR2
MRREKKDRKSSMQRTERDMQLRSIYNNKGELTMTAKKEYSDAALRACQNQLGLIEESIEGLTNDMRPLEEKIRKLKTDAENLRGAIEIMEGRKGAQPAGGSTHLQKTRERPVCKKCQSDNVNKQGYKKKRGTTTQVWRCMNCGHRFTIPMETFEIYDKGRTLNVGSRNQPMGKEKGKCEWRTEDLVQKIKEKIDAGESCLYQDLGRQLEDTPQIVWKAASILIEKEPNKYEQYKDVSKKHHIRGIRLVDASKRKNAEATGAFCPECKTLMIPGQSCKKCNG